MIIRERFEQQLEELRTNILQMGQLVEEELQVALVALKSLDRATADRVYTIDAQVDEMRHELEDKCFGVIVTQQPAARDLRSVVAVMNMIVDLERMGDQAKGIAKTVRHIQGKQPEHWPHELEQMGSLGLTMLQQAMTAYQSDNIDLARFVSSQDDEMDKMFANVFTQIMTHMTASKTQEVVQTSYELLRAARELERFGDLATNIAERVIYRVTGQYKELNVG